MDIVIIPFYAEAARSEVMKSICDIDSSVFGEVNGWNESNFLVELPGKKELSYIAFSGKEIAGYLIGSAYKTETGQNAHINRIASKPKTETKGTGRELVRKFELSSKELGCKAATLEFDSKLNVAGFYEKCGYRAVDQIDEILKYVKAKNKERIASEYTGVGRRIYKKDLLI
jgi:ribosomal protein S18 acetylase RimI-like enzyme